MRFFLSAIALLLALFLASCATNSIDRRIQRYPALFDNLSDKDKDKVFYGEIAEGMSRDAVFLAWGRANRVIRGSRSGRDLEQWLYFGTEPVNTVSVGFGSYGYYGSAWDFGSGVDYVPVLDRRVEFKNGRVVAWDRMR